MQIIINERMTQVVTVILAVIFGVLLITLSANAVSTISTNISTGGTLDVTGHTTLTTASSTITSQTGNFLVNGYATTTALNGNIATAGTLTVTGASTLTGDVTMSGGNGALTITTSNSATSTLVVGCIQTYATSTETAVNMQFHASSTLANSTNGATAGLVVWKYGSCPI